MSYAPHLYGVSCSLLSYLLSDLLTLPTCCSAPLVTLLSRISARLCCTLPSIWCLNESLLGLGFLQYTNRISSSLISVAQRVGDRMSRRLRACARLDVWPLLCVLNKFRRLAIANWIYSKGSFIYYHIPLPLSYIWLGICLRFEAVVRYISRRGCSIYFIVFNRSHCTEYFSHLVTSIY